MEGKYVRRFTTAPKDYDYPNTHEGRAKFGAYYGNKIVRELFILEEKLPYQEGRNQSGLYCLWTREELEADAKYGSFKETPEEW